MLKLPGGLPIPEVPVSRGRIASRGAIAILPAPLLRAVIKTTDSLKQAREKWVFGGDAAEILKGVNIQADRLEIVTTKAGTEEICTLVPERVTLPPADREGELGRDALVEALPFPVKVRSRYAELTVEKVVVEVYGDLQYNIGGWGWGDPFHFEADYVIVVGARVPIVPLSLKHEKDTVRNLRLTSSQ